MNPSEPTIVATVALTTSNSYVTWQDAEAFFRDRLEYEDWTAFDRAQQARGLVSATKAIDEQITVAQLDGAQYDATTPQALLFPRSGDLDADGDLYIIPDIVTATCLLAVALLQRRYRPDPLDVDAMQNQGVSSLSADGLSVARSHGSRFPAWWPQAVKVLVGRYWRINGGAYVSRTPVVRLRDWSNDGVIAT